MPKTPHPSKPKGAIVNPPEISGHGKSEPTPDGTKIIAFVNFKGGVGKTTCAVNVAGCLAKQFNKKVLLIDLDVQSSVGQWLMGPALWYNWSKHRSKTSHQIFLDVIMGAKAWSIQNSTLKLDYCPGLRLSPATFQMLDLDNQLHGVNKPLQPKPFQCLDVMIKPVCYAFDYVIFDCPPNTYLTTQNALFCADHIIIPTVADFLSTAGLKHLVGWLADQRDAYLLYDPHPAQVTGIVINLFNGTKKGMKDTVDELSAYVAEKRHSEPIFSKNAQVFPQMIHNLADVAKAQEQAMPVSVAFPTGNSSKDFIQLTHQIMGVV